jgi:hypothetical protein
MLRAFFSIAGKLRAMMPWITERAVALSHCANYSIQTCPGRSRFSCHGNIIAVL